MTNEQVNAFIDIMNAPTDTMEEKAEKAQESKLRRKAKKQGYILKKSRATNLNADNRGGYMIIDANTNVCVGGSRFDMWLDDIESFL